MLGGKDGAAVWEEGGACILVNIWDSRGGRSTAQVGHSTAQGGRITAQSDHSTAQEGHSMYRPVYSTWE